MSEILQDIKFDENGNARFTRRIAFDFFSAPRKYGIAGTELWREFMKSLKPGAKIIVVSESSATTLHSSETLQDFYWFCKKQGWVDEYNLIECGVCAFRNLKPLGYCEKCGEKFGNWLCPKCGRIIQQNEEHDTSEKPCIRRNRTNSNK